MLSAGHLGFDGLLGFLPGFLPLPGFLAASATARSSSSKTTRWCHRMMYCGLAVRGTEPLCPTSTRPPC